jgi:uncharacterized repeat protein (TIGR03803 family)
MKNLLLGTLMAFSPLCVTAWAATAPVEAVVFSASDGKDGGIYYAGLSDNRHGVLSLYGATDIGGSSGCDSLGCGTVFLLTPPAGGQTVWVRTVLHTFNGGDGAYPQSRLMDGNEGALFGTTARGGSVDGGTIFKLTPPTKAETVWKQSVLHSFSGASDGTYPSGVIADRNGALYGTTEFGGGGACGGGCGTVFKLDPPADGQGVWTETILHRFHGGSDGANPLAELVADADGALYGTTPLGGGGDCNGGGCGVVFKLVPPASGHGDWTESILYRFRGGSDGAAPNAGLIADREGALYGATTAGGSSPCACGAVFRLAPPADGRADWTETLLYSFRGGSDGGFPNARLSTDRDGAIYGSTNEGGDLGCLGGIGGCGTAFKLTPTRDHALWTETVLHRFTGGSDGAFPGELLVADRQHALYGTAAKGGGGNGCGGFGCGVVFEINLRAARDPDYSAAQQP